MSCLVMEDMLKIELVVIHMRKAAELAIRIVIYLQLEEAESHSGQTHWAPDLGRLEHKLYWPGARQAGRERHVQLHRDRCRRQRLVAEVSSHDVLLVQELAEQLDCRPEA
jgi:hypothetical protein